ncbi:MAG: hypothetical protein KatS3mg102_2158 [Planctomycetota bacterium]|nr:MAG: hypothetical protein KatS3mg102_2158 [Planctomycetota bacterium]
MLAYLGRGRAELELGRLEDAEATFGEALYLEVPFRHPNPERHAELVQFVLDAKAEAYYWLLVSQVRARRFEAAVETFRRMTQQFPQGKDTHFGKLAVLTYGKALAGLGRYTEAGEAIQQVLDAAMRSEKVIPGYDIDPYGVSACKTLAEIAEQTTGFFPAPLQYRAGQGFIFKRELEKATWALKGVLAGARTERERQTWGPRALLDLAIAYERLGRLYEAALAYQGLYRMFPDDARADRALRLARQRYQELAERDRWFRALADEVTRDIQVRLSGIGAEKAKYNQAVEWQRQGRYADAARKFLEVQPEIQQGGKTIEVDFYGSALANAGYCFFLAAREASGALAEGYRQQAEQALHKAFTFGQQRGEPGAQAAAAYYLALMEASEERAAYEQALERLQAFQGPLAADRVYRDRALGLMVHCLLRLGRLAEAERTLQALRQDFPQSDEVASRAFQLGDAYAREAARHTDARDRAAALTALRGASRWLRLWLEGNPDASFEHRAWVGNLVFRSGDFKAAAAILEGAVRAGEAAELSPAQREALVLPYARLQLAICLHRAGQHERALEQLERAAAEFRAAGRDPQEEYLYASARSDALFALWQQRRDAARLQELKAAHEAYWQLLDRLEEDGWQALAVLYELPYPSYFVAKLEADARLLEIYLGLKQWRFVHNQIEQMLELGKLDDVVHTRTRGDVIGRIESEGAEGVTVRTARGETVVVAAEEVSGIERVPPELRQRFLQMQERARQEGGL